MATTVTLTGTGVPYPAAGRAGAGTLVRCDELSLQFDAGRGTTVRLADLDVLPHRLTALFLTHLHSDHISDVPDLAHTRWVQDHVFGAGPLPVVVCRGHGEDFLTRMFEPYAYDVAIRRAHVQHTSPEVDLRPFELPATPAVVWASPDERVVVEAVRVRHDPVEQAVGYRITTPDAVVVVSGDTRVCPEIEELASDADVLVHEACRATALGPHVVGTPFETIFSYHADTVALGAMAQRAGVRHLVLTHLIPAPATDDEEAAFRADVRQGGYTGELTVGRDLVSVVPQARAMTKENR